MVTKEEYEKEMMELLQDLFGNADHALRFHDTIPLEDKIENGTIHKAILVQQNVCRCCWRNKVFPGCRHYVKRIVDSCDGAFAEIRKEELDTKPGLKKAALLKVRAQLGLTEKTEVS
jgi:hypothetical protein